MAWLRTQRPYPGILVLFLVPAVFAFARSNLEVDGNRAQALALQFDTSCQLVARPWVPDHLSWDYAFIGLFLMAVVVLVVWLDVRKPLASTSWVVATLTPVLWAVFDFAENAMILRGRSQCLADRPPGGFTALYTLAILKWVSFGALVLVMLWLIGTRLRRPGPAPATQQTPQAKGGTGICCSGGGIRSASFSLGALHGLGNEKVRSAHYLAAVSGGGYTAAGMTIRAAQEGHPPDKLPFSEGSPELRRLRAKSSYLALNGQDARIALGRAAAMLVLNLLILYLVVVVLGRPLGWVIQADVLHPELRGSEPTILDVELTPSEERPAFRRVAVERVRDDAQIVDACADGTETATYWNVELRPGYELSYEARPLVTSTKLWERGPTELQQIPGQVRLCDGMAEIVAQPQVLLPASFDSPVDELAQVRAAVHIDPQPAVRLADDDIRSDGVADFTDQRLALVQALEIEREPRVTTTPRSRLQEDISIDGWMWGVVVALLFAPIAALAFNSPSMRGRVGGTLVLGAPFRLLFALGMLAAVVLIVAPWIVQEVPRALIRLPSWLQGIDAGDAASSPFSWIVGALAAGGIGRAAASNVLTGISRTKRGLQVLLKVAAYVVLVTTGLVMAVDVVGSAALVGPAGTRGSILAELPVFASVRDFQWWIAAVVALWVARETVPIHAWSLNPLYRDKLAAAFLGLEKGKIVTAAPAEAAAIAGLDLTTEGRHATTLLEIPYRAGGDPRGAWPELVICCAVNLNDLDWDGVPAGRWSDGFTFSASQVGSPGLGYTATADYLGGLSQRRARDLSVPSLVATSGAAVSSAMGKHAFGAIGGLLAVLNVRLGLWAPNPLAVESTGEFFGGNPGWPYLVREVFGKYSRKNPFLYVTDGGHWENLGLVELLRRRCTEVYVISAAGDGAEFFPTIGEAIALAREQTGIELKVELSHMRPRMAGDLDTEGRQLLRGAKGELAAHLMAAKPYAVGWWNHDFGDGEGSKRGRVLFIEANLTKGTPWDVHAFAEKTLEFPDHSTGDQFFSNETLEAYRRLGEYQMRKAVASPEWSATGAFVDGVIDAPLLVELLQELS
jgi:hypothetical protein